MGRADEFAALGREEFACFAGPILVRGVGVVLCVSLVEDGLFGGVGGSVVDPVGWVQGVVAVGALVDLPAVVVDPVVTAPAGWDEVVELCGSAS